MIKSFDSIILKEDNNYILVNKPPLLSSLDERDPSKPNLLKFAREYNQDAQLCHRLDKETSGVLVIAKNPEAYRHMSMQLQKRQVEKIYHAVVEGRHEFDNEAINLPIYNTKKGKVRIDINGKEATTLIKTIEIFREHTLVKCLPVTGRLHQIRVHLASVEAPIAMDSQYGGKPPYLSRLKKVFNLKKGKEELPMIQRVALHSKTIRFMLPDGGEIFAEADYPKDIAVFIKQLKKYK